MKSREMFKFTLLLAVLALLSSTSYGGIITDQTIGIDFGSIGTSPSTNFNDYSDVIIPNGVTESFGGTLIDTDGNNVTGVGFTVTNNSGQDTGRALANGGVEGFGLMNDSSIYQDWLISNDTASNRLTDGTLAPLTRGHLVFTFTGLDDSLIYDLTGGWDNNNNNFNAIWQADGQSFTTDTTNNVGYGTLTGLSTDGSGNLAINVVRTGNQNGRHVTAAGLYLTSASVPEPSSLLLCGLASVLGLALMRRRNRRSETQSPMAMSNGNKDV